MTPKEKAQELVDTFLPHIRGADRYNHNLESMNVFISKQCALIAVDEIMKQFDGLHKPEYCAFDAIGERKFTFDSESPEHMNGYDMTAYWEEVKAEIEKL
jgi:hypothetical protein